MFQLQTGKVVYLTVEEYLNLSDEDIQGLIAGNLGDYPTSYWDGSVIKKNSKPEHVQKDIDYESGDEYDEARENREYYKQELGHEPTEGKTINKKKFI